MFQKGKAAVAAITLMFFASFLSGCGGEKKQAQMPPQQVKVMNVLIRDVPLRSEYAGQIAGKDEVKVQSKVAGKIVEKYVRGGQFVEEGQPLFKIDSRQYESAVLQAQANLAQAEANYTDAMSDLTRYQKLLESAAIAEQVVANQQAKVNALYAAAASDAALLQKAQEDLDDTVVYAPMSGQLSIDDVAIGTFANPGTTTLVTIGANDPIYAKFSISETEYMMFLRLLETDPEVAMMNGVNVGIRLSDGAYYTYAGKIVEIDRALAQSTGSLTIKALFPNPEGKLLPGMFARVILSGRVVKNAKVVPQRAVQQLLGKTFVMVANKENKSEARTVTLGPLVGSYYIIESGLNDDDLVIVEGLTNLHEGKDLAITMTTPEEMGFTFNPDMSVYNPDEKKEN